MTAKNAKNAIAKTLRKGGLAKGKSKKFKVKSANRRYEAMVKRTNPLKKNTPLEKAIMHTTGEAIGVAGGAAFMTIIDGAIAKYLPTYYGKAASYGVAGTSLVSLLGARGLEVVNEMVAKKKANKFSPIVSDILKGAIGASVVMAVSSLTRELVNKNIGLAGVDYTPMSGVDYTPMSGVDYTPMSGVDYTPMGQDFYGEGMGMITVADPGLDAESPADFGMEESPADFGMEESPADFGMEDDMGYDFY